MSDRFDPTAKLGWVRRHGLSIALFTLFFVSWVGQFFTQVAQVDAEARAHGERFAWSDFWPEFGAATFENWQSEFLQLLSFVVLTAHLIHRGSHESKESSDRQEAKIDRILELVEGDNHA